MRAALGGKALQNFAEVQQKKDELSTDKKTDQKG